MTRTDEQYAEVLRERVGAATPSVEVDLDRVLPRARRRRAAVRGGLTTGTLVLVLGAAWGATALLGGGATQGVAPAGPTAPDATLAPEDTEPSPEPSPTDEPEAVPTEPAVAVVAEDGTVTGVPGDPWDGDERWWYVRTETEDGAGRRETWSSRERPGLLMSGGDPATATGIGPSVVMGTFVLDGTRYDMLTDPRVLPRDPDVLERVLRDGVEPDRRQGSDNDKVFGMAYDALIEGGLYPEDLRKAFWEVAQRLPGATVSPGESRGRPVEVLVYTGEQDGSGDFRLARDPGSGLLLEIGVPGSPAAVVVEQGPVDDVPVEPTLANAGCSGWATC